MCIERESFKSVPCYRASPNYYHVTSNKITPPLSARMMFLASGKCLSNRVGDAADKSVTSDTPWWQHPFGIEILLTNVGDHLKNFQISSKMSHCYLHADPGKHILTAIALTLPFQEQTEFNSFFCIHRKFIFSKRCPVLINTRL